MALERKHLLEWKRSNIGSSLNAVACRGVGFYIYWKGKGEYGVNLNKIGNFDESFLSEDDAADWVETWWLKQLIRSAGVMGYTLTPKSSEPKAEWTAEQILEREG